VAYTTLISTAALAADGTPDWVIVDCRFDLGNQNWGLEQYRTSHIPGAVYASLSADLAGPRTGTNGRHPLPTVEALAATFSRLGITNTSQVVVYDQTVGLYAGRLWWSLRYLGHEAVALLDGGWAKWIAEGRPVKAGEETRAAGHFMPSPRPRMVTRLEDVQARLADGRTLLIDARGADRFEGRTEPIDRVAGHIPGARNHYYMSNTRADGTFLAPTELRQKFDAVMGDRPPGDVVMYCGSGVSACHNLLAMELAGLPGTQLYPGSWSEWSADPNRPIETGPEKGQGQKAKE
jgi:thiosulfate/3-mercaptopyruvate sulfurtransferase